MYMPTKIQLPNEELFRKDCDVMRWHQLVKKYGVSKNTVKLWKKEYKISNVGVAGARKIVWDVAENGCWNCISHKASNHGYPQGSYKLGRRSIAKVMYERKFGEVQKGLLMRHKCDNPMCINPDHLETGTTSDNMFDRDVRGRTAKAEDAGQAKLTWEQIRSIRAMKGKASQRKIAKMFDISQPNVHAIFVGKSWKEEDNG